jgi:hypothetical protein
MTFTRFGLLGLCAIALSLMTLGTAGAQAEGTWLILNGKKEVKTGTELPAIVELEKDSSVLALHAEILKIKLLILCTNLKLINARLLSEGSIGEKAGAAKNSRVLFSGCTTDLNGVEAPECAPTDPIDGNGSFVTKGAHASLVGEDLLKVLPDEGETFATLIFSATCPGLLTSVPVIGQLFLRDCEGLALTHLIKHLIETGPGTELFLISKTTEHALTILGSAWAKLGGPHAGLAYSNSNR